MESLVDRADTILVVRVVSTEDAMDRAGESVWVRSDNPAPPYSPKSNYGIRVRFKTLRTLKQQGSMPEVLRTGFGGGDCGVELLPANNYLILTNASGAVTSCSGYEHAGFGDAISCSYQAYIAAIEKRIEGRGRGPDLPRSPGYSVDQTVVDALRAGRSPFEAGCAEKKAD